MARRKLNSRFTHDAVRAGDRVWVCNTEAGEVQELAYPGMNMVGTMISNAAEGACQHGLAALK